MNADKELKKIYAQADRDKKKAMGLVRVEVWVPRECKQQIRDRAETLRNAKVGVRL